MMRIGIKKLVTNKRKNYEKVNVFFVIRGNDGDVCFML